MKEMKYSEERCCYVLDKGTYGLDYCIVNYGLHPCCYVFLPKGHKFYGKQYDEINCFISCHGGLTFSAADLSFNPLPNEQWVIGWDYGHYDDYSGIYENEIYHDKQIECRKWTTEELLQEVKDVIEQLM